jgi:hypothetical protein
MTRIDLSGGQRRAQPPRNGRERVDKSEEQLPIQQRVPPRAMNGPPQGGSNGAALTGIEHANLKDG